MTSETLKDAMRKRIAEAEKGCGRGICGMFDDRMIGGIILCNTCSLKAQAWKEALALVDEKEKQVGTIICEEICGENCEKTRGLHQCQGKIYSRIIKEIFGTVHSQDVKGGAE